MASGVEPVGNARVLVGNHQSNDTVGVGLALAAVEASEGIRVFDRFTP